MITLNNLYLKKKIPEISKLELTIGEGEVYVLLSSDLSAPRHLFNIFSGVEQDFQGRVEIDSMDIRSHWRACRGRLCCVGSYRQWPPDMKVGHVVSFYKNHMDISDEEYEEICIRLNFENACEKKLGELKEVERRNLFFSLTRLRRSVNYIIRDFAGGMPLDFNLEFKKNIGQMKRQGCSILYMGSDVFFAPEIGDRIGFMKKGRLLLELKAAKMKKMNLKELYFQFLVDS
jgi:ABC-type Na+ transport system ATPase subunit NatA